MRAVVLALIVACGGAPEVAPATSSRAADPIATKAGPTDEIVAQVNGRPVWASCVAAQGAALAKLGGVPDAKKQALDECIAFELLAQEADKRGLADDAEVVDATRTAIVNRVVELGFEQKYTKPADIGERLEKWKRDNAWRMHRPELRASAYIRVLGPDDQARPVAQAIHDKLANETGLFKVNLDEAVAGMPASPAIEVAAVSDKPKDQLVPEYSNVLFAIPEVGRIGGPVKTKWGWDVILWTGGLPAKEMTADEMAESAFPEMRRSLFPIWVAQIARDLGLKPEIDPAQLARLDEVGP